jgi:riboflavin kinase/FMN adenylyltransferase
MRILRHLGALDSQDRGAVVAIGNFDGVHRGHQALLAEAVRRARALDARAGALTFEPHPRRFFRPGDEPFLLTRFRTKARLIGELAIDRLYVPRFDRAFAGLSPEAFIDRILCDALGARHVVVGYDFVFGAGRKGTASLLHERLAMNGVGATVLSPVATDEPDTGDGQSGRIYSSTVIRESLVEGDPARAAQWLGRPFEIEGRVRQGDRRGRLIGFPTANVGLGDCVRPRFGVYAVRATRDGRTWHDGVANLGLRPTFGGTAPRLEVHLFEFAGDLYGRCLRTQLLAMLRPERRFETLEALKAQIARDATEARAVLGAMNHG